MKNGKTTSRSELYEVQSNADSESPKISTGKNFYRYYKQVYIESLIRVKTFLLIY